MSADGDMRRDRIERLLRELEYEITRGIMEREIDPRMGMSRILPGGPTGYVSISFDVRPSDGNSGFGGDRMPKLRVVGNKDEEPKDG
jgi:hypothetical protein